MKIFFLAFSTILFLYTPWVQAEDYYEKSTAVRNVIKDVLGKNGKRPRILNKKLKRVDKSTSQTIMHWREESMQR